MSREAASALERVRAICLALPEATERVSHGTPTWFVRERPSFATFVDDHHGDGRLAIWCAAPPGAQSALIASDSECYFRPAYVGTRGWIGVRLDRDLPWETVAVVLEEAYRAVAPPKLLARLEGA